MDETQMYAQRLTIATHEAHRLVEYYIFSSLVSTIYFVIYEAAYYFILYSSKKTLTKLKELHMTRA